MRLSEQLKIDEELLCDSFAAFIASPYTETLKAIREELKLNQSEFAELVGLKASYYYRVEKRKVQTFQKSLSANYGGRKYKSIDKLHIRI